MALFSLTKDDDYASRKAAIARQEKLAEMLSQMGAQEQAVYTAGGITAPVSPMSALARGLSSSGGAYMSGKAAADEAALKKAGSEELVKAISQFGKPYKIVDTAAPDVVEPGGEPLQQYTMKTPDSGEMLGEASRIMGLGVPGSEAIGAKLYSTASDAAERETAYNRLKPLIDAIPDEQARKYFDIAAKADPAKAAASFGDAGVEIIKPKKPKDLPASVDEYNFAQTPEGGGFTGSYTDWLKTKTGATTRITVDGGRRDFSLKTGLRKEFNLLPDVKAFNDVASSYDVISDLANRKQPSPQDDLSLIYSYVKMLDPESVVREGEFATAENSASVPDRIRNAYNKVIQGTRLNSDQRRQYSNAAKGIYESRSRRYNDLVSEYSDYARDAGLDPKEVFRARGKAGPAPATEPSSPASGGWVTMPNGTRVREQR